MEITNPRRMLAVSRPESGLLDLLKGLTGLTPSMPGVDGQSIAGTSHTWLLRNSYYSADVPIWLDEIVDPAAWASDFLAPEAREVLSVLGAFVVCFRKPITKDGLGEVRGLLESVAKVIKEGCGYGWDGVCLAIAMPQSTTPYLERSFEDWEDDCQEFGFEFVDFESKGRNEFSEPLGLERLKEALETNDWSGIDAADEELDLENLEFGDEDEEGSIGFGITRSETEEEMAGMKQAIYEGSEDRTEDDNEVERLQELMSRLQAVRDMGVDLPDAERKRFAAKAVRDVMKSIDS